MTTNKLVGQDEHCNHSSGVWGPTLATTVSSHFWYEIEYILWQ